MTKILASKRIGTFGWECPECKSSISANVSGSPGLKRCVDCKFVFAMPTPDFLSLEEELREAHEILYNVRNTLSLNGLKAHKKITNTLKEIESAISCLQEYS